MTPTPEQVRAAAIASVQQIQVNKPISDADKIAMLQAQLQEALKSQAANTVTEPRTYHSSIPFIRVPVMRAPGHCEFVQFLAGTMETSDPAVIAVMEAAIVSGGSGFSHAPVTGVGADVKLMQADIKKLAETAQTKMVNAGLST